MSDEDKKVISLDAHRAATSEQRMAELAAQGKAFTFEMIELPDACVGTTEQEVVIRFDSESLHGYALTPDGARKLAIVLIEAAGFLDLQKNGMIVPLAEPDEKPPG